MSLTFYYAPMSTASTVHWSLEELGIPYEAVKVNIRDQAAKEKALAAVNPNLKVPVLVHDGVVVFESVAIQIYLGETFGVQKGLYPAPGPARGHALKWLVWANVSFAEAMSRWLYNTSDRFPEAQKNAVVGAQARRDIDTLIRILDEDLGARPYILGDAITLVDIHLASCFQWARFSGVDLTPFPKVAAWADRCLARPANARSMAA